MNLAGKPRRTGKYRLEAQGDIRYAGLCQQDMEGYALTWIKLGGGMMQGGKRLLLKNRLEKNILQYLIKILQKAGVVSLKFSTTSCFVISSDKTSEFCSY